MATTAQISQSPFPGLRAFSAAESDIFFGREALTDQLLEQLVRHRLLALIGAPGCGKSSIVAAGLAASVRFGFCASAGTRWRIAQMRPGADPFTSLAQALRADDVLGPEGLRDDHDSAAVRALLVHSPNGLADALRAADWPAETQLLLVIDPFDDLFRVRQTGSDSAAAFVQAVLRSTMQTGIPVHVVITLRPEYLGQCALFPGLPEAIVGGQVLVPRLTREQCRVAICAPARVFNAEVEGALLDRLLNDFGSGADDLPLLSHGLMRMWTRLADSAPVDIDATPEASRKVLRLAALERAGGLARMLADHAEETLRSLGLEEQRIAQIMWRRLTESTNGTPPDRRVPATVADVAAVAGVAPDAVLPVALAFRRAERGFVLPPADETPGPDSLLDVAHEALLHHWPTLIDWIAEEGASAATYRRLCETASLWSRGEASLWVGPDLHGALAWERRERPSLPWSLRYGSAEQYELAMRFLRESEAASAHAVPDSAAGVAGAALGAAPIRQGPRPWTPRPLGLAIAVAAALAVIGLVIHQQRDTANTAAAAETAPAIVKPFVAADARDAGGDVARAANVRALLAAASDALPADPELSALLALEAREMSAAGVAANADSGTPAKPAADAPRLSPAASAVLARAVAAMYGSGLVQGPVKSAYLAAWSPDGKLIATAASDHSIQVWNSADGKVLATLRGHTNWIGSLAFSPDSTRLVSASSWDNVPRVWRLDRPDEAPVQLPGHRDGVLAVAFSADGKKILTAGLDGNTRAFDSATGKASVMFKLADRSPRRVAFSADGRWLAEAKTDSTMRLRSVTDKRPPRDLGPVPDAISTIAFDPSGDYVFAIGREGSLRAWAVTSGRLVGTIQGEAGRVQSAAMRADERVLVAAGVDNTATLFDVGSGRKLAQLLGHKSAVLAARFASDAEKGTTASALTTIGTDGVARSWNVAALAATGRALPLRKGGGPLEIAVFNGDASMVALSGVGANRIQVYDVAGGQPLWSEERTARDHQQPVSNFAFSADGHWLVTASHDASVKVWDARSGFPVADLVGHRGSVNSAVFSPDAREVVSAGSDGTARVWAIATRKARLTLKSEDGALRDVAWSSDGSLISAAGGAGAAPLWRADDGAPVATLRGHAGAINQVAWQRDGRRLLTLGTDETIRLWDATGKASIQLPVPIGPGKALHVAYSPDSQWFAVAMADGTVRVGNAETGVIVTRLPAHATWVSDATFLPDSRTVRTIGGDGVVRDILCEVCLPERELVELARAKLARVKREFSTEEARLFGAGSAVPIVGAARGGIVGAR